MDQQEEAAFTAEFGASKKQHDCSLDSLVGLLPKAPDFPVQMQLFGLVHLDSRDECWSCWSVLDAISSLMAAWRSQRPTAWWISRDPSTPPLSRQGVLGPGPEGHGRFTLRQYDTIWSKAVQQLKISQAFVLFEAHLLRPTKQRGRMAEMLSHTFPGCFNQSWRCNDCLIFRFYAVICGYQKRPMSCKEPYLIEARLLNIFLSNVQASQNTATKTVIELVQWFFNSFSHNNRSHKWNCFVIGYNENVLSFCHGSFIHSCHSFWAVSGILSFGSTCRMAFWLWDKKHGGNVGPSRGRALGCCRPAALRRPWIFSMLNYDLFMHVKSKLNSVFFGISGLFRGWNLVEKTNSIRMLVSNNWKPQNMSHGYANVCQKTESITFKSPRSIQFKEYHNLLLWTPGSLDISSPFYFFFLFHVVFKSLFYHAVLLGKYVLLGKHVLFFIFTLGFGK